MKNGDFNLLGFCYSVNCINDSVTQTQLMKEIKKYYIYKDIINEVLMRNGITTSKQNEFIDKLF